MWVGLLTDRTSNKLESNLINEHVLNHEHVPLNRIYLVFNKTMF